MFTGRCRRVLHSARALSVTPVVAWALRSRLVAMPVPTFDEFIAPLLKLLAERREGMSIVDVYETLADRAKLSSDDRAELLPSGAQPVYKNRIGWAHDRLKRARLSESPKRGFWKLTPEGLALAAKHKILPDSEIERIAYPDRSSRVGSIASHVTPNEPPASASPEERIEAALLELRESTARDLLENIARSPPELLEHLVLDLLLAMGYGASRADLQRVGGSGDGGIDGIISLDRLGLEKVYVQAKRWKASVGSPEIQTFMGALQLQSASKGVFITTSSFTKDAKDAAARARGHLVLVDGARLAELMMDHGVGVTHKLIRVPRVDSDYFDDA
jgi:restriction system protein